MGRSCRIELPTWQNMVAGYESVLPLSMVPNFLIFFCHCMYQYFGSSYGTAKYGLAEILGLARFMSLQRKFIMTTLAARWVGFRRPLLVYCTDEPRMSLASTDQLAASTDASTFEICINNTKPSRLHLTKFCLCQVVRSLSYGNSCAEVESLSKSPLLNLFGKRCYRISLVLYFWL